mmetsp:Transcript_25892/g.85202  ORF Transcript_25892/g.85202 Transcript_25892/m.85202 type:complete len:237 (-) Transcript_25892:1506-2216(-)
MTWRRRRRGWWRRIRWWGWRCNVGNGSSAQCYARRALAVACDCYARLVCEAAGVKASSFEVSHHAFGCDADKGNQEQRAGSKGGGGGSTARKGWARGVRLLRPLVVVVAVVVAQGCSGERIDHHLDRGPGAGGPRVEDAAALTSAFAASDDGCRFSLRCKLVEERVLRELVILLSTLGLLRVKHSLHSRRVSPGQRPDYAKLLASLPHHVEVFRNRIGAFTPCAASILLFKASSSG